MSGVDKVGELVAARVSALRDTQAILVRRAINDLARLEVDPWLLKLVETLKGSSDWNERIRAWEELHDVSPATPGWDNALRGVLHTGDGWGKILAAEIFAWNRLRAEEAVPVLTVTIQATIELGHLEWARVACGALGRYGVLPLPLVTLALPALLDALDAGDSDVILYAAETLGSWGGRARRALVGLVGAIDRSEGQVSEHLLASLKKIEPSAGTGTEALLVALDEADPVFRADAARALFLRRELPCETAERIAACARDNDPRVRKFIALALGNYRSCSHNILRNLERLSEDDDAAVRLAASHASVRLDVGLARHLKILEKSLAEDDRDLRVFGAWSLGDVGWADCRRSTLALRHALASERDENVRAVLRKALENLADEFG
ncbi:MAG: HEAT repeat domain-containing protein [Desulfuromonadales bacterium]|nr:MAG: HEAT repeat domain-containing protein [Desulfuromonadales bacterium]